VVGRILAQRLGVGQAVAVPGSPCNLVLLGFDVREVLHSELVNLVGGRVERRVHADPEPIRRLATRCAGDARLGTCPRLVFVDEEVTQPVQRRIDVRLNRGTHLVARIVVCDLRHANGGERFDRRRHHPLDLLDLLANRHGRRGAPVGDPLAERLDLLLDRPRIGCEARQQSLEALGRVGHLVLGDPDRHRLRAKDVVDRELVLLLL
jgi:hypothetical protein